MLWVLVCSVGLWWWWDLDVRNHTILLYTPGITLIWRQIRFAKFGGSKQHANTILSTHLSWTMVLVRCLQRWVISKSNTVMWREEMPWSWNSLCSGAPSRWVYLRWQCCCAQCCIRRDAPLCYMPTMDRSTCSAIVMPVPRRVVYMHETPQRRSVRDVVRKSLQMARCYVSDKG